MRELSYDEINEVSGAGAIAAGMFGVVMSGTSGLASGAIAGALWGVRVGGWVGAGVGALVGVGYVFATSDGPGGSGVTDVSGVSVAKDEEDS